MKASENIQKRIVLIGGGHSHALFLKMWAMAPLTEVEVTLITPEPFLPYTGMFPGLIAGYYEKSETYIDLVKLVKFSISELQAIAP